MPILMENSINLSGLNYYLIDTGIAIFGLAIINSNYKIVIFSNSFSIGAFLLYFASIASYILTFAFTSEYIVYEDIYNSFSTYKLNKKIIL